MPPAPRKRPSASQPSERLAEFLPYLLSVASNAVSDRIAEQYRARFGLSVNEWRMMAVLGDSGALTQRDLADRTLLDKVAVNRASKTLVGRGLVERSSHSRDGRSHLLQLTPTGSEVHDEIMPLAKAIEQEMFAQFSDEERAMLRDVLIRLRVRAGGDDAGAG